MTTSLIKPLYTARATVVGGRDGRAITDDGSLDVAIKPPKELGGPGEGTNPEQLFAAGYGSCFQSALSTVARRQKVETGDSTVECSVTLGTIEGGAFGLAVNLRVTIPGLDADTARTLVEAAHAVCPYSNATRGNVEVTLEVG